MQIHKDIDNQIKHNKSIVQIDLSFLEGPKPSGSNYLDVVQNSQQWLDCRIMANQNSLLIGMLLKRVIQLPI